MRVWDYLNGQEGVPLLVKYGCGLALLVFLFSFARAAWIARDHMPEGYSAPLILIFTAIFSASYLQNKQPPTP